MKAIILAGGEGTRLRPLTYTTPKPLIDVQDKTLTEHVFDILKNYGVTEAILSVSYMADKIKNYFEDGFKFGMKLSYLIEERPMGTAGPLILLKKMGCLLNEDFMVVNGDNLFSLDLAKFFDQHKKNQAVATIALTVVSDVTNFGIARLENGRILEFIEKPSKDKAPGNLANSGYYVFSPEIFEFLPEKNFVMLEKDIFPVLAKENKLFGYPDNSQWFDTGTPQRYEQVKKEWRGIYKSYEK
ncbi:nucleotidyltransferase family protein [Candidatus Parcubacteria bacterium]|nr:MAG: nucleotidyltransferase family protein [Candidatus Parcubacteria bacterium]